MKKLVVLLIMFVATFSLAACELDPTREADDNPLAPLSSEQTLASMTYLSAGFLSTSTADTTVNAFAFMNNGNGFVIEEELDDVNVYMDLLKEMINNGTEGFGSVTTTESTLEGYEHMISFTVNENTYEIHYNVDQETEEITGIIVIDSVQYEFEVVNNLPDKDELEDDDEADVNDDDSDDDAVIEDEADTEDEEESEEKMVLVARNGDDTITIKYKIETETEDGETESETKFDMTQNIGGVEKHIFMKISQEEDEYKVKIEEDGDSYTFKRDSEEEGINYRLEYEVDGTKGWIMIKEDVDENGEVVYRYKIHENGSEKDVDRGRPEHSYDDDEEDEDENEEETEEENDTIETSANAV